MSKLGQQSHYKPKLSQTVTTGATSAATTNPISAGVNVVRLIVTGNPCFVKFGPSTGAATTSDMFLAVSTTPEYFSIRAGDYVHAIQSGGAGSLKVTELTQ